MVFSFFFYFFWLFFFSYYFFKSLTTHEHVASSIFRKEKEKGYHPSLPPSPSPAFLEEKGQAEVAEGTEGGKEEE